MSLFLYDRNWADAEKEFQRALALNPNYALAHQCYGHYQRVMGRQNWTAEVKRAHELDPLSLIIAGSGRYVAGTGQYVVTGQNDVPIEDLRKKLEIDPNFAFTYLSLGAVYTQKRMYQDAIAQIQKGLSLSGGAPEYLSALGYTYGVSGKRDEAMKILQQLAVLSKRRYVSPYDIARVYVGLGEKDLAFDWLQKAVADHSPQLVFRRGPGEVVFERLHSDARYAELERQIGLPQ